MPSISSNNILDRVHELEEAVETLKCFDQDRWATVCYLSNVIDEQKIEITRLQQEIITLKSLLAEIITITTLEFVNIQNNEPNNEEVIEELERAFEELSLED